MTAASFWSLLLPALEIAEQLNSNDNKLYSLFPVIVGFLFGAFFVHLADVLLPENVRYNDKSRYSRLSQSLN